MLKKRIVPTLLLKNQRLVKGKNFENYRDVGDPMSVIKIYSNQYSDELILINIGDNEEDFKFLLKTLEKSSEKCFIPITAGGGIDSLDKVSELIKHGADRVLITSAIFESPEFILKASEKFGKQSIIGGIDILENKDKFFLVYGKKRKIINYKIEEYINKLDQLGVGEILVNFVKRDGEMKGTNIELLKYICNLTSSPVIVLGGIGNFVDIEKIFKKTGCDAIACASIFHFADNNPIRVRSYLKNHSIDQRIIK